MTNTMRVYACGGCGIDICKPLANTKTSEGFADILVTYADTSGSNLFDAESGNGAYTIEGANGSGKKRLLNRPAIAERSKDILQKNKPGHINVIVHSAGGGSGGVFGFYLTTELLNRGERVVVIMVGSSDSVIDIKNTQDTIKSYEGITRTNGKPVVAMYFENSKATPRGVVDSSVRTNLVLLASLFSGVNERLDAADLHNFLYYTEVTSYPAKLVGLEFLNQENFNSRNKDFSLIGVAAMIDEDNPVAIDEMAEYITEGIVHPNARQVLKAKLPIYACTLGGYYNETVSRISNKYEQHKEALAARVFTSVVKNDEIDDDGLVF